MTAAICDRKPVSALQARSGQLPRYMVPVFVRAMRLGKLLFLGDGRFAIEALEIAQP